MGGVAGLCHLDGFPVSEKDLKRMSHLLAHRGQNGKGIHKDKEAGLANTRLAVFDLSDRGLQPMSSVGGRYWITFDGEIFNFLEIKRELKSLGYPFKTDTDTEVLLAAYMAWGPKCIEQFQGMWAFALWDEQERSFFLARDRFGCKPLYYYCDRTLFAFASEVKGFLGIESLSLQYDSEGLAAAFAYPSLIEGMEQTLWKGVKRLLPGHTLTISKQNPLPQIHRWWHTLSHLPEISPWPERQIKKFRTSLFEVCQNWMKSDVPIGFGLNGGVDSSAIFACVQEIQKQNRNLERATPDCSAAFAMQWKEAKKSKVLEEFILNRNGRLVSFRRDPDQLRESIFDMIYHFEEVGPLDVARWSLFQTMRQENIRVGFEGFGADIVCAIPLVFAEKWAEDCFLGMRKAGRLIEQLSGGVKGKEWALEVERGESALASFEPFQIPFLKYDGSLLKGKLIPFLSPIWQKDGELIASMEKVFQLQYFLSHGGYLQTLLRRVDLSAMAHGVEVRCPFLDWKMVACSLALSTRVKLGEGSGILQKAMDGILPEKLLRKQPVTYPFPGIEWLEGSLRELVEKTVEGRFFQNFPFWDGRRVGQLVREGSFQQFWPYFQAFFLYLRFQEARERVFSEG